MDWPIIHYIRLSLRVEFANTAATAAMAYFRRCRRHRDLCFPTLHITGYPQFRRTGGNRADRRNIRVLGVSKRLRRLVSLCSFMSGHACKQTRRSNAVQHRTVHSQQSVLSGSLHCICRHMAEKEGCRGRLTYIDQQRLINYFTATRKTDRPYIKAGLFV